MLARVVHLVVSVIVLIIVAGILFVLLKANPTNSIVSEVHDWASSLAGPFDGMFSFHNTHGAIAVNWGIAAVAYLLVGGLITHWNARQTLDRGSRNTVNHSNDIHRHHARTIRRRSAATSGRRLRVAVGRDRLGP